MKYTIIIAIIFVVIIWGGFQFTKDKPEKETPPLNCYSEQCKKDLAFIEEKVSEEWEEYFEALNTPEILFDGENLLVTKKGYSVTYENKTGATTTLKELYADFAFATVTVPMSPEFNMQMRVWNASSIARDKQLKDNQCAFNLICPSLSDEDKISALREIYETI